MLPEIRIASPCTADWERMIGDDRVRHCAECDRNVYNLSRMTSREIERLIAASNGQRLCGRLYRRADGTMLTRDCPVGFRALVRRVSRFAGAALSAALSVGSAAAQSQQASSSLTQIAPAEAGIAVVVADESGAVIPKAQVSIKDKDGKVVDGTTDQFGRFSARALLPGSYDVRVRVPGFKTKVQSVVAGSAAVIINMTVEVAVMGGMVVFEGVPTLNAAPDLRLLPEPPQPNRAAPTQATSPQPSQPPRSHGLRKFLQKLGF